MTETCDLLLTGATVLDPAHGRHEPLDVAVRDGRIAAVGTDLDLHAREHIDLTGQILTPGWIDIHAHVYAGATTWGIHADALCLATGVTTIVDAGSPGWANLPGFVDYIAGPARTRVLTFVHISGIGLTYGPIGECEDIRYADPERAAAALEHWRETCVGIKVRQGGFQVGDNGIEPLRRAVQAAAWTDTPVMVHIATGTPLRQVLAELRSGDIVTHCYQGTGDGILNDENGQIEPVAREARELGVLFDVGHGGGSFRFDVARDALAQDFPADVISTDLHAHNIDGPVYSLPETASKLLNLGVPLEVVRQCTSSPAAAIGRPELGRIAEGDVADLAAFEVRAGGQFEFRDVAGDTLVGAQRIEPRLTVRGGTVYRPDELAAECADAVARAQRMRAFTGRNFAALGWQAPA